ncbi:MAG: acetate/propionate family kinase [Desulfobacterales bacterium]|nr:acetate/propionate family kinase [Desulfobacterales bacterium]
MQGCISVINSGSSSIKFSVYDHVETQELRFVFGGQVEGIGVAPRFKARANHGEILAEKTWDHGPDVNHESLMGYLIGWIRENRQQLNLELTGVGHRVVHGGSAYSSPVKVDDAVLRRLEKYIPLAPLHQPHNLGPIRSVMKLGADIPQVACFDTAFHRTNPPLSQIFALPRRYTDEGIRRYGFHGLSYEYISRRLQVLDSKVAAGRVVVAHLGSGASMCALQGGRSIASTMGFSAMDGIPMGTRPGNLDPGVVLYLMQEKGTTPDELADLFYKRSGLLGISGVSNDMRILLESSDPQAEEAIGVFVYRIQRELGSLAAALGGLDALVFTAGVGENSPAIRARVCEGAQWLGLQLDPAANDQNLLKISTPESQVSIWVIPTNEELMIATHTRNVLLGAQE